MSSPSPPPSPRDDVLDADVNDDGVFQDLPPRRHAPHAGISMADLLADNERFGDVEVESGDVDMANVWEEVEEDRGTGLQEPQAALTIRSGQTGLLPAGPGSSVGNPIDVDGVGAAPQVQHAEQPPPAQPDNVLAAITGLITVTQALRSSRGVKSADDVLLRLCNIVSAAPPFAFPSAAQFVVNWPPLAAYTSIFSINASQAAFWCFEECNYEFDGDLFEMLWSVKVAGDAFCDRRKGSGDQSVEAHLKDLQTLAGAIFKASDDIDWNSHLHQPQWRLQWIANKMEFVMGNMLAVIEAEKAYHGVEAITSPVNIGDWYRVRHRFNAVLERTPFWEANLQRGNKFLCVLFSDFEDDEEFMKQLRDAMNKPLKEGGTRGWPSFQKGHTKYSWAAIEEDDEFKTAHLALLDLLPFIQVSGPRPQGTQPQNLGPNARPPIDLAASKKENTKIRFLAQGLVEQYISLLALLRTCSSPAAAGPWAGLLPYVQLNERHTNPRSILIFKTAFLVLMMADRLWRALEKHEDKGHINRAWAAGDGDDEAENEGELGEDDDEQSDKAELWDRLESMVRVAAVTQVEAAREGLRYEGVGDKGKAYW